MVFSSLPLYLDPPNWPQQQNQQGGVTTNIDQNNPHLPPPPPGGGGGGTASVRPGTMSEQARLAKIPRPEAAAALKCPRCESTNTKFCYFNNYSLSQPRHFCKTCRRYWTRGGALRSVPVGGGCRRNKRSKGSSNRSKSSDNGQIRSNVSTSSGLGSNSCTNMVSHMAAGVPPQLPVLPPLHNLGEFNSGDVGLSFAGIQPLLGASGSLLPHGLVEQWRLQQGHQFPFLSSNLESSSGLCAFDGEGVYGGGGSGGGGVVKIEDNGNQGIMNLSRNFLGLSGNYDHQVWGGNNSPWTDLSGFTSSSTSHIL